MCSGFLVIDVSPLLVCVFLLDGSTSVVVGLSPCTAPLAPALQHSASYAFIFTHIRYSVMCRLGGEGRHTVSHARPDFTSRRILS